MAEKPILFSAEMVRAILAGRKTQTRRVVKESRCKDSGAMLAPCEIAAEVNGGDYRLCPYGVPGDTLWLREQMVGLAGGPWLYAADRQPVMVAKADQTEMLVWAQHKQQDYCPSIHMPRWASRITLRVTGVRVERLQEISEEDAKAEGITYAQAMEMGDSYRGGFRALWHTIHAANGPNGWAANPWVWVIEFEKEGAHA